jgi:polygalacturonase
VDPESVDHMLIEDCDFDTGDDCIAVNSGRNADGRRLATPSQNILVRNCRMKEGHGGVVVGSQISGGARWVFAENCHMDSPDLWYAIRFKNNALRGGLLENFYYRDIDVGQVAAPPSPATSTTRRANGPFIPQLRNVVVERLRVKKAVRVLDSRACRKAPGQRHHHSRQRVRWRHRGQHHQAHPRSEAGKGESERPLVQAL